MRWSHHRRTEHKPSEEHMLGGLLRAGCVAAIGAALVAAAPRGAAAYSAAGDRLFPATLVLPQIAPADAFYVTPSTLPQSGAAPGAPKRTTSLTATFTKTLTERLGIVIDESWTRIDRVATGASYGWQNHDMAVKYLAVTDQEREFLVTLGLGREFGGTGAKGVGASASGATTPAVFFGKGLGDLDIGYWRPLSLAGLAGFVAADSRPRPNLGVAGLAVQYSIPYLQSKVESLDLAEPIRGLTPMTEFLVTTPAGRSFGARTTLLAAPGVSYAGPGWEIAAEALIPLTRATGRGIGMIAQFHLSLDYLFADSIGRPLFSP
jgi:hypothetical protein